MKKTTLNTFTIWYNTKFGLGCFKIKAKDFIDAYNKLSKKIKSNNSTWIENINGDQMTLKEIKNNY